MVVLEMVNEVRVSVKLRTFLSFIFFPTFGGKFIPLFRENIIA